MKHMAKKIILLGEDEKDIAEMYKIVFEKAGFEIVLAANGEEVIKKAKEMELSMLLLDINMPVKDGFEVLQEAAEDPELYKALCKVPIVILSNYNNTQDVEYCIRMGAQDYIVKSEWTPDKIVEKVKKILGQD
jgi:CheY-like chemotaxis protein